METNPILTADAREAALAGLPLWQSADGRDAIQRMFRFKNFREAMNFFGRAMPVIDRMDHHPEWANIYNRTLVVLTTHNNGNGESGLTRLDIELAKSLDALV